MQVRRPEDLLEASDTLSRRELAQARVPPVLTVPPNVAPSTCTVSTQVNVGQASATDECVTPAPPTAKVVGSNNYNATSLNTAQTLRWYMGVFF